MSTTVAIAWLVAAVLGVVGSALFSGLETGVYTVNRVRLHMLAHAPRSTATTLLNLVNHPNNLLGTLLIGNNLANYVASLAIAALLSASGYAGWRQIGINALILTPVLLIFGEILPKDLFRSHTDRLTYFFARPLHYFQQALKLAGLLPLVSLTARILRQILRAPDESMRLMAPRRVVGHLLREGVGHGLITAYQSQMSSRVLEMGRLRVADVMVPWGRVATARVSQPPEAIWALANRVPFTRLPLLDHENRPVGVVDLYQVLTRKLEDCPPLAELSTPLATLPPDLPLRDALARLQQQRLSLALIAEDDRPLGIVTTKDLVEPLVGELESW
ncbi:MAG: CNNM domain-containing protein [Phycisphaerae bacterium]|nr:CNNM domain-containing protein [Phycisphaerae bacterium]